MGEKINAIHLLHHAFPKYIPAFLSPRQKLYWGTLCYCPLVSPSSWFCSPNRTSLQPSTVYIDISHFSCKDFRTVRNFNKRKLLFCSACSGNNTHKRTLGGMEGVLTGIQINGHILGRQVGVSSIRLQLPSSSNMSSSLESQIYSLERSFRQNRCRFCTHCCLHCSFFPFFFLLPTVK